MTVHEDQYHKLRQLNYDERRPWLRENAPTELRGHWWLSLIEHAEFDASPLGGLPVEETKQNLEFVIDLIEAAIDDGMPAYYATSRLGLVASSLLRFGEHITDPPIALVPDNWMRRALSTFRLTSEQALEVAAHHCEESSEDDPNFEALREICWLLPDLDKFIEYVKDERLIVEARKWLDISEQLFLA